MDFTGLIVRFPSNRPLTDRERRQQLHQKRRLDLEPRSQLSVVRMNSTYLESVDKWFAWKGVVSAFSVAVFLAFTVTVGVAAVRLLLKAGGMLPSSGNTGALLGNGIGLTVVVGMILWCSIWLLRKESFAYTYYPIRFNRRTRMVHVWRTNGTVLTVPWDDLFFTLFHLSGEWEVRGHVLAADKATILESFALSYSGVLLPHDVSPASGQFSDQDLVRAHWEFIRRYMEEGPQSVSDQVNFCMPVDGRRETAKVGMHRVFANFSGASWITILLMAPIFLTVSLFRVLAMRTGKIPCWPADVEAACAIEPGDPYAISGNAQGERVAAFPDAARAAGVQVGSRTSP